MKAVRRLAAITAGGGITALALVLRAAGSGRYGTVAGLPHSGW